MIHLEYIHDHNWMNYGTIQGKPIQKCAGYGKVRILKSLNPKWEEVKLIL